MPRVTPAEKEARLYATRFVFRRVGYVAAIAGVLALAYLLRGVLLPLFLAFLLAYALDPLVERLARLKVPRALAALVVMLGAVVLLAVVAFIAVPYFAEELANASAALPDQLLALRGRLEVPLWEHFHVKMPHSWTELFQTNYGEAIRAKLPGLAESVVPALFGTFNFVVVLAGSLIIPVFALYLLTDFDDIVDRAAVLIPRRYAATVNDVAREVHVTLGRYVRGQITASLVLAFIYAVGLRALGIRLAIPIGVLTGILAFVPYIGFGLGLILAVTMAVLDWHGAGTLLGVLGVMAVGQIIDGFLVTPRIVGGSVGLKPIEVLLTMMGGATLFGFLGVLLAVPLGAVVKILVVRATDAYLRSPYYRQIPPTPTPTPLPMAVRLKDDS
jgi:predicted PurR-regulated permease PerM